ncbi:MAG: SDR family NAD(P)-dependent oxidoreductase [Acidimicrobiia bacterium]|nr:SDR family NAD(P)-dependent oxidoreductase [Acidimicrobiia bacterium]
MASTFADRYGPLAVVTGAAVGMGAAFARDLAGRGLDLLLVDRDERPLEELALELQAGGTNARPLVTDLAAADAAGRVCDEAGDQLGLLVNNAALGYVGSFLDQSPEELMAQLDVNCRTPLLLVHRVLPQLVARGRGGIVLLSSLSAMRGSALVASYAATKAWNLILAESLWDEVRETGVDVLGVLPGMTRTPGLLSSSPQAGLATANLMEPADVAREALDALGHMPSVIPSQANRDGQAFLSSLDRGEAIKTMGDVMRTTYPPDRAPDPSI